MCFVATLTVVFSRKKNVVMCYLTLWGCQDWRLSQQQWSRSLCTRFQTATLQTGTAGSKIQSTIQIVSALQQTAFHVKRKKWRVQRQCLHTRRDGWPDMGTSPGTLFWLVLAPWDAAEREHSDCLKNPSHRSALVHPRNMEGKSIWTSQLNKGSGFICFPL